MASYFFHFLLEYLVGKKQKNIFGSQGYGRRSGVPHFNDSLLVPISEPSL